MKRFHVNVAVADFDRSRQFYTGLFATAPAVLKKDYAKWMLDDPRLNFSITRSDSKRGIQHLGLQADSMDELGEIQQRLAAAGQSVYDQPQTECCYARSSKTWTSDPDGVPWENFVTHEQIAEFGTGTEAAASVALAESKRCCA
jgi:catechol 2,3-dioxygenase-like lactoylglutathione lyase family enzyme